MRLAIVAIALLVGCTGETTSDVEQSYCTIEDQQNGTCTLPQFTSAYIDHLIESYGAPTSRTNPQCGNTPSGNFCTATVYFGSWHVNVHCVMWSDEYGENHQSCSSTTCWDTPTGTSCTSAAPAETSYCTEGDPECGDPGGGGGPSGPDVAAARDDYAMSLVTGPYAGYTLVAATSHECHISTYGTGHLVCTVSLDFGSFRLSVMCEDGGPSDPHISCASHYE